MREATVVNWSYGSTIKIYVSMITLYVVSIVTMIYWCVLGYSGYSYLKTALFFAVRRDTVVGSITSLNAGLTVMNIVAFCMLITCWLWFIGLDLRAHNLVKRGEATRRTIMKLQDVRSVYVFVWSIFVYSILGIVSFIGVNLLDYFTSVFSGTGFIPIYPVGRLLIGLLLLALTRFVQLSAKHIISRTFTPVLKGVVSLTSPISANFAHHFRIVRKVLLNTRDPWVVGQLKTTALTETSKYYVYAIRVKYMFPYVFVCAPGVNAIYRRDVHRDLDLSEESLGSVKREKDYTSIGEIVPKREGKSYTDRAVLKAAKSKSMDLEIQSDSVDLDPDNWD